DPGPPVSFAILLGGVINGSTIVQGLSSTSSLKKGMLVIGTGIPVGDTIAAIGPITGEITLSAPVPTVIGRPNPATLPLAFGLSSGSGLQGDLRYCVSLANAENSLGLGLAPTIQFAPGLAGKTITLRGGPLELSGAGLTTINGAGRVTVSGGGTTGVFQIDAGAQVDLTGLTITGGKASDGAGINNAGSLTLSDDTITRNSAGTSGGGIS